MLELSFHPMNVDFARQVIAWQYAEPYDIYNVPPSDADDVIRFFSDPVNHYFATTNAAGDLVAFWCFGEDGRVPGGDYSSNALDFGGGLRPDLTGRGLGIHVVQAALSFGRQKFQPTAFRVTVATFNKRAMRIYSRAGFRETQRFRRKSSRMEFAVLVRDLASPAKAPNT